jgi:CRISPR-associated protein Cas1
MSTLYIDRKNIRLACDGEALMLYDEQSRVATVPMRPLQRVILRGQVQLDTSVLGKLGNQGIGLICLSGRKAEPSLFLPRAHNDAARRIAQYRSSIDPALSLRIARHIVREKITAQIRFLENRLDHRLDARYMLKHALTSMQAMLPQVDDKPGPAELRGLEGACAAQYFSAISALAPDSIGFHRRNRRPPKDPLNAVLSLGYTLLHAEATLSAHSCGLDPCIGFFHVASFARESLACDLVEAQRAEVDAWALALFTKQVLRKDDFSKTGEGCFLGKAGRERFYRNWEPLAENLRKGLETQARTLIAMIQPEAAIDDTSEAELIRAWNAQVEQTEEETHAD